MTHLAAIEEELDATEIAVVRAAVVQMNPATLEGWKEKMLSLSPKEAAQVVRDEVAKRRAT